MGGWSAQAVNPVTPRFIGPHFVPLGGAESERYESWPWLLTLQSQGRLTMTQHLDSSVADLTITQFLDKLDDYLYPIKPSFVTLEFGMYDLLTQTVAQFTPYYLELLNQVRLRGIVPVICTILPRPAADGNNTSTYKARAAAASMWMKNLAAAQGLPLIDLYTALVDPATGSLKTAYATSSYMAVTGYKAAAEIAYASLEPYLTPWAAIESTYEGDSNNLIPTAFTLPDTNADGIPNGWSTYSDGTGTAISLVTDARFKGSRAIEIAATAADTDRQLLSPNLNSGGTSVSAGDVCAVTFSYSVESSSGLSIQPEVNGLGCWVQMPAQWQLFAYHSMQPTSGLNKYSGLVYFPVNGDPAGWYDRTMVALMFRFQGVRSPKQLTVRIGDLGFYNLTKMGALVEGKAYGSWNWVNSYAPSNYWPLGS